jgi:hypothetical protein
LQILHASHAPFAMACAAAVPYVASRESARRVVCWVMKANGTKPMLTHEEATSYHLEMNRRLARLRAVYADRGLPYD